MELRNNEDLTRNSRERHSYRKLLGDLRITFVPLGDAIDRLYEDSYERERQAPHPATAKEVLADVKALAACGRDEVKPHLAALGRFARYVANEVEVEKAVALADRLARQCLKAGVTYGRAQTLLVKAMDAHGEAFDALEAKVRQDARDRNQQG